MLRIRPRTFAPLLALLAAGLLAAPAGAASRHPTAEESPLVSEADELLAQIDELVSEHDELQNRAKSQGGEERTIVALQLRNTLTEFIRTVEKLVTNVAQQREEGIDDALYRERTRKLLWRLDRRIPEFIDQTERDVTELRASKEGADAEARAAIEERVDKLEEVLDDIFRFYRSHIGHLETLGLSSRKAQALAAERLATRAVDLSTRAELASQRLEEAQKEAGAKPDDDALEAATVAAQENLDQVAASLWTTCDVMEDLDLPTAEYRATLVTATGEITTDLLDLEVVADLAEDASDAIENWFEQRGPAVFARLSLFFGILLVFWVLGKIVRAVASRLMARAEDVSELARRMIIGITSRVVMIIGIFVALSQIGVNVTALVAGLGIAGFIVGFALQDTLGNFASGAMILAYRPFDVGDVIEAGGVSGKVHNMNLVSTTILTFDNQTLVVPNSKIWGDVIRNVTYQTTRRVDLEFHLSHDADVEQVEKLFDEMCRSYPTVLDDPPPAIRVHEVKVDAVVFIVRPWVKTEDYWSTYWDLNREAKVRLAAAGIAMGATRHDVHVQGNADPHAS